MKMKYNDKNDSWKNGKVEIEIKTDGIRAIAVRKELQNLIEHANKFDDLKFNYDVSLSAEKPKTDEEKTEEIENIADKL